MKKQLVHLILSLFLITVGCRLLYAQTVPMIFFFDQGRDFIIASEILSGDLKIFGPSASGTQDTVYHGVLYYYFLAGILFLAGGDPLTSQALLIAITSVSIIPVFLLSQKILKNTVFAVILSLCMAISIDAYVHSSWLSNPSLSVVFVPLFYYSLWMQLVEKQDKWMFSSAVTAGLVVQSMLFGVYILVAGVLLFWFVNATNSWQSVPKPWYWAWSAILFLLSIATMILVQSKLFLVGIFRFDNLNEISLKLPDMSTRLNSALSSYEAKIDLVVQPNWAIVLLILALCIFIIRYKKHCNHHSLAFISVPIMLPFLVGFIFNKSGIYNLIGTEAFYLLLIVYPLQIIWSKSSSKFLTYASHACVLVFFLATQYYVHQTIVEEKMHPLAVQKGMYYQDIKVAVEDVFHRTRSESFSFSSLSNPYRYASTWIYLFNWYAEANNFPVPSIYMQDQTGMFGSQLMEQTVVQKHLHLAIIEPNLTLDNVYFEMFVAEQMANANVTADKEYGSLRFLYLKPISESSESESNR
jgi:hypothetical protein